MNPNMPALASILSLSTARRFAVRRPAICLQCRQNLHPLSVPLSRSRLYSVDVDGKENGHAAPKVDDAELRHNSDQGEHAERVEQGEGSSVEPSPIPEEPADNTSSSEKSTYVEDPDGPVKFLQRRRSRIINVRRDKIEQRFKGVPYFQFDASLKSVTPVREAIDKVADNIIKTMKPTADDPSNAAVSIHKMQPPNKRIPQREYKLLRERLDNNYDKRSLHEFLKQNQYHVSSSVRKSEMLNIIMDKMWALEIKEIVEKPIQELIPLDKKLLYFLVLDGGRLLRSFAQFSEATISVMAGEKDLQVYGPRESIDKVRRWIHKVQANIIASDIDLSWGGATVELDTLRQISRLTNTYIERLEDMTVRIWALKSAEGHIESAVRLILNSIALPSYEYYKFLVDDKSVKPEMDQGALFGVANPSSLPWKLRDRDWARWRLVNKPDTNHSIARVTYDGLKPVASWDDESKGRDVQKILSELDANKFDQSLIRSLSYHGYEAERSATLGYILFEKPQNRLSPSPIKEFINNTLDLSVAPPFQSFIPNLQKLVKLMRPADEGEQTLLRLFFQPDPWLHSRGEFPALELTLKVEEGHNTPVYEGVRAVYGQCVLDLMCPSERADLRFMQSHKFLLKKRTLGTAIEEYIKRSRLDMNASRLIAAPNLVLPIPDFLRNSNKVSTSLTLPPVPDTYLPEAKHTASSDAPQNLSPEDSLEAFRRAGQSEEKGEIAESTESAEPEDPVEPPLFPNTPKPNPYTPYNAPSTAVTYLFTTMDLRFEQRYLYRQRFVTRATIEGGTIGGRRTEMVVSGAMEGDEKFVRDAMDMVDLMR